MGMQASSPEIHSLISVFVGVILLRDEGCRRRIGVGQNRRVAKS